MIQDQYSDRSFRVFADKLQDFDPAVKDTVKTAEINYDEYDSLPETAFAWPEMRKLAIHTPEHAALSIVYAHNENLPKHVNENLEKAAELYDLHIESVEKVAEEVADDFDSYMIPQQKFDKITEPGHVKKAARFFSNNYKKMDLETRTHAAATLVKKAEEYGVKVSPSFYKHAGMTQCSPKVLGEWLEVRRNLSQDETIKEGFNKLASYVQDKKKFRVAGRGDMVKLAQTIASLDEKEGFQKKYDLTLPDPILTVFNTTKTAEQTVVLANRQIPVSKLAQFDPETYGDILGDDIVPEISEANGGLKTAELVDVLQTLPADLQMTLVSTLQL